MPQRNLSGWVKDLPDVRDLKATDLVRSLAPVVLPTTYRCSATPTILDQGGTSECVAYAHTLSRIIRQQMSNANVPKFDPDALYKRCKELDGIPDLLGTYPRVCLDIMFKQGMPVKNSCCRAGAFDFQYRLGGYWRIDGAVADNDIKQILMQLGPFTAASSWYNEWGSMFNTEIFPEPTVAGGGHCYCIQGWNETGWEVDNSWGTIQWGVNGIAWMPYSMFRNVVLPEGDVWKMQGTTTFNKSFRNFIQGGK